MKKKGYNYNMIRQISCTKAEKNVEMSLKWFKYCADIYIYKWLCVRAVDSPLSCSMKQTFPWALKARVSGVIHRVWKRWDGLMLCSATTHCAHTAHTSSSDRQLSRRERMSARDTFSCGHTHKHTQVCPGMHTHIYTVHHASSEEV